MTQFQKRYRVFLFQTFLFGTFEFVSSFLFRLPAVGRCFDFRSYLLGYLFFEFPVKILNQLKSCPGLITTLFLLIRTPLWVSKKWEVRNENYQMIIFFQHVPFPIFHFPFPKCLAGVGGFEPPNPGSKDLCLTA